MHDKGPIGPAVHNHTQATRPARYFLQPLMRGQLTAGLNHTANDIADRGTALFATETQRLELLIQLHLPQRHRFATNTAAVHQLEAQTLGV